MYHLIHQLKLHKVDFGEFVLFYVILVMGLIKMNVHLALLEHTQNVKKKQMKIMNAIIQCLNKTISLMKIKIAMKNVIQIVKHVIKARKEILIIVSLVPLARYI